VPSGVSRYHGIAISTVSYFPKAAAAARSARFMFAN
jgi:hypothetical protein